VTSRPGLGHAGAGTYGIPQRDCGKLRCGWLSRGSRLTHPGVDRNRSAGPDLGRFVRSGHSSKPDARAMADLPGRGDPSARKVRLIRYAVATVHHRNPAAGAIYRTPGHLRWDSADGP